MPSRTSTLLHQLKNLETRSGNNPRSLNSLAAAVAIQRMVERILDGWMKIGDTRGFNWFEHRSGGTMARDVSERKDPFDAIVVELMKDGQFRQQIEEIINHSPESDSPIFGNLAREYLNNPNIGEDTRRFLEELFERPTRDSSDKGRQRIKKILQATPDEIATEFNEIIRANCGKGSDERPREHD